MSEVRKTSEFGKRGASFQSGEYRPAAPVQARSINTVEGPPVVPKKPVVAAGRREPEVHHRLRETDSLDVLPVSGGVPAGVAVLAAHYAPRVHSFTAERVPDERAVGPEDVAQDALEKLMLTNFNSRGARSVDARVSEVASNEVRAQARRSRGDPTTPLAELTDRFGETVEPGAYTESDAQLEELHRAVLELPEQQRDIITLRYLEGMTMAEAGEIAGKTPAQVKSSTHDAIVNLRTRLSGE